MRGSNQLNATTMIAGMVAVFTVLMASLVALEYVHSGNTALILGVVGAPMVGVFFTQFLSLMNQRDTGERVKNIEEQVNGKLDERIEQAVEKVLKKHGLLS